MNKRRLERIVKKQQEDNFVKNWSVRENKKEYNALEDPHASFYFCNESVSQHLRGLSKAFNKEEYGKEKHRMKELIKAKVKENKLPFMKMSPSLLKEYKQVNYTQRYSSNKCDGYSFEKRMKNEVCFSIKDFSRYERPYQAFKTKRATLNNKYSKRLKSENDVDHDKIGEVRNVNEEEVIERIHEKERKIFLDFLIKKRSILTLVEEGCLEKEEEKYDNMLIN